MDALEMPTQGGERKVSAPWGGRVSLSCSPSEDGLTAEETGHPCALPSNPGQSPNHPRQTEG